MKDGQWLDSGDYDPEAALEGVWEQVLLSGNEEETTTME